MKERPDKVTMQFLKVARYLLDVGDREVHGYAIAEATGLYKPTVYKMLERMAEMGWLTMRWEQPTVDSYGPARRMYRMTEKAPASARRLLRENAEKAAAPLRPPKAARLSREETEARTAALREALDAIRVATEQSGARWEQARATLTTMLAELDG